MAKKNAINTTATYALFPNAKGDLYTKSPKWRKDGSGKFELSTELSQRDLEFIFNEGHTQIVYKIED